MPNADLRLNQITEKDTGKVFQLENATPTFDSVAAMKSATWLTVGQSARTLGYYTLGDGGGNDYEIVAAATGTDDGGSFIDLTGSGLQAKGLFSNSIHVKQFGAKGDSSLNATSAFQNAIDFAAGSNNSPIVFANNGQYKIDNIIVKSGVTFSGMYDGEKSTLNILGITGGVKLSTRSRIIGFDISTELSSGSWDGELLGFYYEEGGVNQNKAVYGEYISLLGPAYFGGEVEKRGTGLAFTPNSTSGTPIVYSIFNKIRISGFYTGIELAPTGAGNWTNSNTITGLEMSRCVQPIKIQKSSDGDAAGNHIQGDFQSNSSYNGIGVPAVEVDGSFNVIDLLVWDWFQASETNWLKIHRGVKGTRVMQYTLPEWIKDEGTGTVYGNSLAGRVRPSATMLTPFSQEATAINLEDSDLNSADQKYSVSVTTPVDVGSIGNVFTRTENAVRWLSFSGSVSVEIDLTAASYGGARRLKAIGAMFSWGQEPEKVLFEYLPAGSATWQTVEGRTGNTGNWVTAIMLPDVTTDDNIDGLRFTFVNSSASSITLRHLFARFSASPQGAYLPSEGGEIFGDVDIKDGNHDKGRIILGGNYLWVDATGDLRIKSSEPTSDTDGVVVGSQS